jgi:hypothetical protein
LSEVNYRSTMISFRKISQNGFPESAHKCVLRCCPDVCPARRIVSLREGLAGTLTRACFSAPEPLGDSLFSAVFTAAFTTQRVTRPHRGETPAQFQSTRQKLDEHFVPFFSSPPHTLGIALNPGAANCDCDTRLSTSASTAVQPESVVSRGVRLQPDDTPRCEIYRVDERIQRLPTAPELRSQKRRAFHALRQRSG